MASNTLKQWFLRSYRLSNLLDMCMGKKSSGTHTNYSVSISRLANFFACCCWEIPAKSISNYLSPDAKIVALVRYALS